MVTQPFANTVIHSGGRSNSINAAMVLENIKQSVTGDFSRQIEPVIELARNIPAYSGNMLEFHFDRGDNWFDLAFRISKDFDKPLLSKPLMLKNVSSFISEGYQKLIDKQKTSFRYGIENLCFEYDFPVQNNPSLFFDIRRDTPFQPEKAFEDLSEITGLFNYSLYQELPDFLKKIKDNGWWVIYQGLMLSRPSKSIRLTINGIETNNLMNALKTLGWNGNYDLLMNVIYNYLNAGQRIVVAVDFDNCLSNKIGIEVSGLNNDISTDRMYTNKLFNTTQYNVLKKWPGLVSLTPAVSERLTQLHQRNIDTIYRRLNHFKFTIEEDTVTAKAYLYYCF